MRPIKIFALAFLPFFIFCNALAQDTLKGDQLLLRAMKDEIRRNLDHLQEDEYEKPFFIAYTVSDIHFGFSVATLGASISSVKTRNRSWNARVMVGDYSINDENFNNSFQGMSFDPQYASLPIDDDYWGVRRVFWIATNNIYRSAARNYSQKKKALEENDIEYPLADFSEEPPVSFYDSSNYKTPEVDRLETLSKELSARFKGHERLVNSGAYVSSTAAVNYFVSSEGTEVRVPAAISSVFINATGLGSENIPQMAGLNYIATTFDELPSKAEMYDDIDKLIGILEDTTEVVELDDEYTGPVLLEGQAVAEFFIANLLNSEEDGLIAGRDDMTNSNKKAVEKFFKDLNEELQKDEKNKIASSFINVKGLPFLKEFNHQPLIGSFEIDGEGIKPDEELLLVEKGILKTKLNGRTPSVEVKASNGYKRFQISGSAIARSIAPGVLMVSSDKTSSRDSLDIIFRNEAAEEELEFGINIKSPDLHASVKPVEYLKTSFNDSKRERLSISYLNYKQRNAMKKIVAVSDKYYVYNFLYHGGGNLWLRGNMGEGVPVSLIVPEAIVVKDFDVSTSKKFDEPFESTIKGPLEQ